MVVKEVPCPHPEARERAGAVADPGEGLLCAEQDGYQAFDDHHVRSPLLQPREVGTIVTRV